MICLERNTLRNNRTLILVYRAVTRPLVPAPFVSTCLSPFLLAPVLHLSSARQYARAVASYASHPPYVLDSLLTDSLPHNCSSCPCLSPSHLSTSSRTHLLDSYRLAVYNNNSAYCLMHLHGVTRTLSIVFDMRVIPKTVIIFVYRR